METQPGPPTWQPPGSVLVAILLRNLQSHPLPGEGLCPEPGSGCTQCLARLEVAGRGDPLQAEQTWGQNKRLLTERGGKQSPH